MIRSRRSFLLGTAAAIAYTVAAPRRAFAAEPVLDIAAPMDAPEWALLERELLRAHAPACEAFFDRYFDENGFLMCVARWGGDDGPDDAIENVNDWPYLYALGASNRIREMYEKAYEGHVRQYTAAKTTEVPFARDGMYYKEFPVMMDWQHNGEGLSVFNVMGLSNPFNPKYRERVRRFAGFYMNEDPGAPNYDPEHRIIRSLMNGSRGPMLRKATALDWTGDPVEVKNRFAMGDMLHGENSYEQMLAHFQDYNDVIGDHPLNLESTTLALNAYMLAHEPKYKAWLLEYVDAWVERARQNNDILPSNIGLDGKIGGAADGKWYGGVYGWDFSPIVPQTGKRQDRNRVPFCAIAFMSAFLLTGDDKYLDVWRKMADRINAQHKVINGVVSTPRMFGDQGWHGYVPGLYEHSALDIYFLSMKASDRSRAPSHPWISFLEGKNPDYPATALRGALALIRKRGEELRNDRTTPDTRLADSVMEQNPAAVNELIQLMLGGLHIGARPWAKSSPTSGGAPLHCRLRYFDPIERRAGIPEDMAALVSAMTHDSVTVILVNLNPTELRLAVVQAGAYGEHQVVSVSDGGKTQPVDAPHFKVRLAPGAGATLTIRMKRFANQPTLDYPWDGPQSDQDGMVVAKAAKHEAY